jgi:hypothetical protein
MVRVFVYLSVCIPLQLLSELKNVLEVCSERYAIGG